MRIHRIALAGALAFAVAAAMLVANGNGSAHGLGRGLGVGTEAYAAGTDDRSVAEAIVKAIEADAAQKRLAADPLAHAHAALDRAAKLRAGGDDAHARTADALSRDWAELARDLVSAADAEAQAAAARREAVDAGAQVERERALLEEAIARVGRLRAQLEAAEREATSPTPATVTATSDAGGSAKSPRKAAAEAPAAASTKDGGAR